MARRGSTGLAYYPVSTLPRSLDIVWCRYPLEEDPANPGPKSRPGLVRAIALNKAQTHGLVEVTYGTTNLKDGRPFDLHIQNLSCIEACGLPKATRFDLDRTVWLPWAKEYFAPAEGYVNLKIGSLDATTRAQLEAIKVARRAQRSRSRRP